MGNTTIPIEEIKNANSHISAMSLTRSWANLFRKYALNETEDLSDDPASSFNLFMHLTAQGAAKSMYEQAARINETNESTAILPKSLLHKLSADDLKGIFGHPASTMIAFCVRKQDILEQAILVDKETGLRRLIVAKGMNVNYESHPPFVLPYDVIINLKPVTSSYTDPKTGITKSQTVNNIYAYYDMPSIENDGMRTLYGINNQYISTREIRYKDELYVALFLKVFQLERKEVKFYVSDPDTADCTISFKDKLVGVDVYRITGGKKPVETLMVGTAEGTKNTSKNYYNYSYDYKRNAQNFNLIFNKSDNAKLNVGDTIRAIVYTTKGTEGNIKFPYMAYNLTSMIIFYDQDLSIAAQNAMLNFVALAFARDAEATGGKDTMTLEEIRETIIAKRYSRGILITLQEIVNKAKSYGYDCYKIRHDVINMYFRTSGKIIYKDMTLSTGTSAFYFDLSKKGRLIPGYNYYMIEPTDVFKYDKTTKKFNYIPRYSENPDDETVESYEEYSKKYNTADDPESVIEVSFPFFMRYDNTSNPKITVYDMNVKTTDFLAFTKYNENFALDKADIQYIRVQRNPYRGVTDGSYNEDISNSYYITFLVYTGENTLNKMYLQYKQENSPINSDDFDNYNKQYMIFNIEMIGTLSDEKYQIDPRLVKIVNADTMVKDGYIAYQAIISTNNFISDDKQIQMRGIKRSNNLGTDYSSLYPMDVEVKFVITGRFSDIGNNAAYNCITYESDPIKLVRYLTDYFGIDFDIQTSEERYECYDSNVPKTYKQQIFILNPDYDPSITDNQDPNHYEYKVKRNLDGEINFLPGMDANGNTVYVPIYEVNHELGDPIIDYTPISDSERNFGPVENREYYILIDELNDVYEKVENLYEFDPNVTYYRAQTQILHKKGDRKIFDKNSGELLIDETDISNPLVEYHSLPPEYIGILKNVSWINRLYFSNAEMYETIRDLYNSMVDNITAIKKILFDGGLIYCGLKNTSGNSKKYSAYKLSTNETEYIKNIALKFVFRVKFKNAEAIDYKVEQIIAATSNYVNNLGDNDLSIDGLFEKIKEAVPDIQYINLTQLNNYFNGEVQTILNDPEVKTELLTIAQKVVTDSDGNISFEPDVTVNVVATD